MSKRLTKEDKILSLEAQISALEAEKSALNQKIKKYSRTTAVFETLMDEAKKLIKPMKELPSVWKPVWQPEDTEDAVMHLSDEHMDQLIMPEEVGGFEEYSMPIALRRAEVYVEKTLKAVARHNVENLWILAYGDHTNGEIHNSVDRSYYRNQFKNTYAIGQVHALMFRDLAPHFKFVNIVYVPGNHGRRGSQKGRDYNDPWNTWDYAVAQTAYSYTRQISNVHIEIPKSFSALVEIRDHLFAVEHGDGVKSWNGIPFYGLERKSRRLAAIYSRKEKDIDYYVYGHFHQPSTIPATHNSETIINGSWKATDPYIFHEHGGVIEPSQWLHGVHTKQGISWRYRIRLRSADEKQGPKRYKIEMPN